MAPTHCWRCMEQGKTSEATKLAPLSNDRGKTVHAVHPVCDDCASTWFDKEPWETEPTMLPLEDDQLTGLFHQRVQ
jgi:hypothetical protein